MLVMNFPSLKVPVVAVVDLLWRFEMVIAPRAQIHHKAGWLRCWSSLSIYIE